MRGWLSLAFAYRLIDVVYGRWSFDNEMVNVGPLDPFGHQGTET